MAVGCGATCAKILLIVLNIIFILSGLVLIAIGIWLIADPSVLKLANFIVADQSNLFRSAAILLITMGVFVLFVSVFGFVGAIIEHKIVLIVYIVLLAVVFAGECAGGIIAIVYKDKIRAGIDTALTNSLLNITTSWSAPYYQNYTDSSSGTPKCKSSGVGATWDYVQVMFSCCGVHGGGGSGYETSNISLSQICPMLKLSGNRPQTCCVPITANMAPINTTDQAKYITDFNCDTIITVGCSDALMQWIEKYAPALIGIGMGIGMFQLVVIIFAVCLCQHINRKDHMLLSNS
jgi:hypothetical protein